MAAKVTFKGMDEYISCLEKLSHSTGRVCSRAVYAGAGVVADAIRQAIHGIPEISDTQAIFGYVTDRPLQGITPRQKEGLLDGLGISQKEEDGSGKVNVKIGFNGYNSVKTRRYPKGQPNAMVARGVESGSSAKLKSPFVRPAVNRVRSKAEAAMAEAADQEIQKILNESE